METTAHVDQTVFKQRMTRAGDPSVRHGNFGLKCLILNGLAPGLAFLERQSAQSVY
jgi:hypothetical protein